jgi:hypothetical protein
MHIGIKFGIYQKKGFNFWNMTNARFVMMVYTVLKWYIYCNTQNQPGNKAKTSARHKGEHPAPFSPRQQEQKADKHTIPHNSRPWARPGRRHAPLDLTNIPTGAQYRKKIPLTNPTLSLRRAPSTNEAREAPPGPLRPACAEASWPAGSSARTTSQRRGRTCNHS